MCGFAGVIEDLFFIHSFPGWGIPSRGIKIHYFKRQSLFLYILISSSSFCNTRRVNCRKIVKDKNIFNLGGKNEEILVNNVVNGADYGLQCVGLRGRCQG
jgi:hypothetical protein